MPHTVSTTLQGEGLREAVNLQHAFQTLRAFTPLPPPPPGSDGVGHLFASRVAPSRTGASNATTPDGIIHASTPLASAAKGSDGIAQADGIVHAAAPAVTLQPKAPNPNVGRNLDLLA